MKKTVIIILLGILAGLGIADIAKSDDNKTTSPPATTQTTEATQPTNDNSATKTACASLASTLGSDWTTLASTLKEAQADGTLAYPSVASAAKDAIDRGITATRAWTSSCGSYFPEEASTLTDLMDQLEALEAQL